MSRGVLSDREVNELNDLGAVEGRLASQIAKIKLRRREIWAAHITHVDQPVSDHGLMRYLERVEGLDIEAAKTRFRAWFQQCEPTPVAGIYKHASGHLVVTNKASVIVTVLPAGNDQAYKSSDL